MVQLILAKQLEKRRNVTVDDDWTSFKVQTTEILPIIHALATDSSHLVRLELCEHLPKLFFALGREISDVIVDLYVAMFHDAIEEIRLTALKGTFNFYEALLRLGQQDIRQCSLSILTDAVAVEDVIQKTDGNQRRT